MKGYLAGLALVAAVAIYAPAFAEETPPHIDTSGANAQPAYPASALPNKERGAVLLRVGVSADGKVTQIRPLQTSGFNDLDSAAISGVMAWRFLPAKKDGQAVPGEANLQIGFVPPDTDSSSGPPAPSAEFLPPVLHVDAQRKYYEATRNIPCTNAKFQALVEFVHPTLQPLSRGVTDVSWAPAASLEVSNGNPQDSNAGWVTVAESTNGIELPREPQESFSMFSGTGNSTNQQWNQHDPLTGEQILWLSWDAGGKVAGSIGNLQPHLVQLAAAPTQMKFIVSSGDVSFHDPQLTCYPSSPISNGG